MKGFIIYPTYKIINNIPYICLYGRLENDQSFLTLNEFKPYFFIKEKDSRSIKNINKEKTSFKDFNGNPVAKIIVNIPSDVPKLREKLEDKDIECYEADIKFVYRFLIDNNLQGSIDIEGDYESNEEIDRIYKNPEITPVKYYPNLNVASIDIETNKEHDQLYCIGIYSDKIKKVLMVSQEINSSYISCKNE
ncbi:hypothetical protein HYW75_04950, partial [Candidatus Pacearchaeota archaeon]|nr:hypothetical protein [Candidatus Pacearchaeota archaeon]